MHCAQGRGGCVRYDQCSCFRSAHTNANHFHTSEVDLFPARELITRRMQTHKKRDNLFFTHPFQKGTTCFHGDEGAQSVSLWSHLRLGWVSLPTNFRFSISILHLSPHQFERLFCSSAYWCAASAFWLRIQLRRCASNRRNLIPFYLRFAPGVSGAGWQLHR